MVLQKDKNKDLQIKDIILDSMLVHTQPCKIENKEIKTSNIQNNTILNKSLINNKTTKEQKQHKKKCWCYNKDSQDMRCCGLCYTFCYIPNKEYQCYLCPETFEIYYTSGYVITSDGYGKTDEECEDCFCTTLCLPTKFALFWPCCIGSVFNNSINYCRDTNMNYLF